MFVPRPRAGATLRLFCFSPAGYGASIYRDWARRLPDDIEVCAVRLPGRENLRQHPLLSTFEPLVDTATRIIAPYLDRPFAIFGHSMGSWVGFEVARRVRASAGTQPVHLFVSGRRAPHVEGSQPPIHELPEDELIAEIQRRYGGIPDAVLSEPELLALTLPILRADLAALHSYRYVSGPPYDCDITCFTGADDREIATAGMEAWGEHTAGTFVLTTLPGGHFYLTGPSGVTLVERIGETLRSVVAA